MMSVRLLLCSWTTGGFLCISGTQGIADCAAGGDGGDTKSNTFSTVYETTSVTFTGLIATRQDVYNNKKL